MTDSEPDAEADTSEHSEHEQADGKSPEEMREKGGAERDDSTLNFSIDVPDPGHRVMISVLRDAGVAVEASIHDELREEIRDEIYDIYRDVLSEAEAQQAQQPQQPQQQPPQQPQQSQPPQQPQPPQQQAEHPPQQPPRDDTTPEEG